MHMQESYERTTGKNIPAEYLRDNPLFSEAYARQDNLSRRHFKTYEDAHTQAFKNCDVLNRKLEQAGAKGQFVTISALEYMHTTVAIEPSTGSHVIQSVFVTPEEKADMPFEPIVFSAQLEGFAPTVRAQASEKSKMQSFFPEINYQFLESERVALPIFEGNLYGFAPIKTTILEFHADKEREDSGIAIGNLLNIEGPHASAIHEIDEILLSDQKYTHEGLARIGYLFREELTKGEILPDKAMHALIDLVKARLGFYGDRVFQLDLQFVSTFSEKSPGAREIFIEPLPASLSVKDLILSSYYYYDEGQWRYDPDTMALSLVLDPLDGSDKDFLVAQFENINSISPE
ncbi:MAG: hypothetical protein JWN33_453 [Candidatus Saccharibacteria bacterium]|nr:hypothetical protein [Candidatus Saccharibacteria bacterium]